MDREFQKLFDKLCYGRTPHSVWDNFIYMSASAIANSVSFQQEREDRYLDIVKKYKPEELEVFGELFARTVLALEENPHQDYLGQIFMELGFGNVRAGQYFTPYTIAEMMSIIAMGEEKERPYETVNDPACGSPPTGDPLFAPEGAWCTPLYYHWIWSWRRALRSLRNLEKEDGQVGAE